MLTAVLKSPRKLYSAAYRSYIRERLTKAHPLHLAELGELYDDDELRAAVSGHPEVCGNHHMQDLCIKHAAVGVIERMLVAEVIVRPDSRQIDIARDMLIDSSGLGNWSYWLGKANILDRRLIGGRVVLAPGKRCDEIGLDYETAASLIAVRNASPESWEPVVYLARYSDWIEDPQRNNRSGGDDYDQDFPEVEQL